MMHLTVPHAGNMYGGTERALETLAQASRWSVDVEAHFVLCFDGQLAATLRDLGARVDIVGDVRLSRPQQVLRARRQFERLLDKYPTDAVVTQSEWSHLIFAPPARRLGLPTVLWAHDAASGGSWITRLAARHRPDWIVCNSLYTQRAIARFFPSVPSNVVYYPIAFDDHSTSTRAAIRHRFDTAEDATVIVNVARMDPYKGQRVLIDALARLESEWPWTCWFMGGAQRPRERDYEASLQEAVAKFGLGNRVRFLGQQRDARALLKAADVCCHPNQTPEAFGLSVVEALQAGLPVVASDLGGPAEIVTGACGRLVPAGDTAALAAALSALLEDPATRAAMGHAAPARAWELCNPEARLNEFVRTIRDLTRQAAA